MNGRQGLVVLGAVIVVTVVGWMAWRGRADKPAPVTAVAEPAGGGRAPMGTIEANSIPAVNVTGPGGLDPAVDLKHVDASAPAATPRGAKTADERAKAILEAGMAPHGGSPAGDANLVARKFAAHTHEELDLVAALNRAGLDSPAGLKGLFDLRRQGASADELKRFVRSKFRGQPSLKLVALKWIDDRDPQSKPDVPLPPPGAVGATDLGSVEQIAPRVGGK